MFLRFRKSRLSGPVRQQLRLARTRLQKRWAKGRDYDPATGGYCLRGAIRANTDAPAHVVEGAMMAAARETGVNRPHPKDALMRYNDTYAQSKEDVVRVIDKALAK